MRESVPTFEQLNKFSFVPIVLQTRQDLQRGPGSYRLAPIILAATA